jgi:pSer/pThr/pTyr-binding forkhead associated (FHA) protein
VRFTLTVTAGTARGQRFKLGAMACAVGRSRGAILFPDDACVSPQHAIFLVKDGAVHVRDDASASGVFVTLWGQEPLAPLSAFSIGSHLFRFTGQLDQPPVLAPGRPVVYGAPVLKGQTMFGVEETLMGGRAGKAVVTQASVLSIGQTGCDFSLGAEEGVAPRHCELSLGGAGALLRDLSGGLGTFVRVPPGVERPLRSGDRIRIGQQILQLEV